MQNKYDEILNKIKQILKEEDFIGLIRGCGAPDDEYDHEASMIFERVNRYDNEYTIRDKLWDVFYLQFCHGSVFKCIDGEMNEVGEVITPREEADKRIGVKTSYHEAAVKIYKIFNP